MAKKFEYKWTIHSFRRDIENQPDDAKEHDKWSKKYYLLNNPTNKFLEVRDWLNQIGSKGYQIKQINKWCVNGDLLEIDIIWEKEIN